MGEGELVVTDTAAGGSEAAGGGAQQQAGGQARASRTGGQPPRSRLTRDARSEWSSCEPAPWSPCPRWPQLLPAQELDQGRPGQ